MGVSEHVRWNDRRAVDIVFQCQTEDRRPTSFSSRFQKNVFVGTVNPCVPRRALVIIGFFVKGGLRMVWSLEAVSSDPLRRKGEFAGELSRRQRGFRRFLFAFQITQGYVWRL
jgi:hypothetical protein